MPDPTTDRITELLAAHAPSHQVDGDYGEYQWVECICDSDYFEDTDAGIAEHRAHVASLLAVLVADAQADAWERVEELHNTWATQDTPIAPSFLAKELRAAIDDTEAPIAFAGLDAGDEFQDPKDGEHGEKHGGNDEVVSSHDTHNTPGGNENP